MSAALNGVRVVELAGRPTALAGRVLADLGAEVLLVEPPGGSSIRHEAPFLDDTADLDRSFAHLYFNANKHAVVVDIETPEGQTQFLDLVATADVLIESQTPGSLDARGLGHDRLRARHAGLIQCSISPFGLHTPWHDRRANDLVAGAAGGLIYVSGSPRGVPVQGGANPSYTMAGLAAVSSITMALYQRDLGLEANRDSGIHIDLSMQEATALAVMQTACPSLWQWHKRIPRRPGLSAAMACKDGKYVGLLVRPDRFDGFLAWADREGIDHGMSRDDWRWARLDSPREGNPVSETTLKLAARLTRDEFVAGALEADIICLPVLDFPDLEKEEQYKVNEQFLTVPHDVLGKSLGFVRSPVDGMADGVRIERAPTLGEHQDLLKRLPKRTSGPVVRAPTPPPEKALVGLRVVDFGWVLAAPIGTRLLASFGAEVIRVESSTKPDSMRSQAGPDGKPHADLGGLYNSVNAGKKSLSIDIGKPAGLRVVKELIATADIVVNNFRPGAMARMGLGYEVLRDLKADIILLNLPGAHRKGPWAQRPSMGNILMAASGFNMLTGFPGERPRGIGIAYPDFTSPHLLVTSLMAALRHRASTGEGQEIHLTQLSAVLALLGAEWMQYKATGQQPQRVANRNPNYCPHGVYPALSGEDGGSDLDEWVAIAVDDDMQWRALCQAMAMPELERDPRFTTFDLRKQHEDELDEILGRWTASHNKWRVADILQDLGIAAAPVEHLRDMLENDPQLPNHYHQVQQPADPSVDIPVDREAARWVGHELTLRRAPMLGEHNLNVVQEILGYGDEAFAQLVIDDVLI